jgi:hypothetical protein
MLVLLLEELVMVLLLSLLMCFLQDSLLCLLGISHQLTERLLVVWSGAWLLLLWCCWWCILSWDKWWESNIGILKTRIWHSIIFRVHAIELDV